MPNINIITPELIEVEYITHVVTALESLGLINKSHWSLMESYYLRFFFKNLDSDVKENLSSLYKDWRGAKGPTKTKYFKQIKKTNFEFANLIRHKKHWFSILFYKFDEGTQKEILLKMSIHKIKNINGTITI